MTADLFAHKNYDDLSSLEEIFQASKNIVIVSLFRDCVPLILNRYHAHISEIPLIDLPERTTLSSNYPLFHQLTCQSADHLILKEPRYGEQRDNYSDFMLNCFYAKNGNKKKKDLYDLYYEDVHGAYWQDDTIKSIYRTIRLHLTD